MLSDSEQNQSSIAAELNKLLADSYTLSLQTQSFYWNIKEFHSQTLRLMFKEQFMELTSTLDDIAASIRSLGFAVPASLHNFMQLTSIIEVNNVYSSKKMLQLLINGHEQMIINCQKALTLTKSASLEAHHGLLLIRMKSHQQSHEKTIRALQSIE